MAEHLPGHLNTIADEESCTVQDRCDWMLNPHVFQKIQKMMGPLEVDLFASRLILTLQLESRPGSHGDRCIHAGLVSTTTVCQSSMVLDSPLSLQGENAISTSSVNHSLLEDPILVSNPTGTPGGLSSDPTDSARSGGDANTTGVRDETGSSPTDCLAYLTQSYSLKGFSLQASSLMLASWRNKTNSNYGSSLLMG